ncbi:hypothetical protein PG991_005392 [Apiospora marii]|uniref:chitinase n=1 Tax=Apiospora marii TaxID=335849 RepID=A0ABR1S9F7_9PEZI
MMPLVKSIQCILLFWVSIGRSAVDLNGNKVVEPVSEKDPSPIEDITTYIPDQYDCPLPCVDYANAHGWTPYVSVKRLQRCDQPMLLQFSVSNPLDRAETTVLIRSCSLSTDGAVGHNNASFAPFDSSENPKASSVLFEQSLHTAPSCYIDGKESNGTLLLTSSNRDGMRKFFEAKDNCDETFVFAYYNKTAAGVYIGAGLGKPTASSALEAVATRLQARGSMYDRTIAQLCGSDTQPESSFGVAIDTTGDLAAVQRAAAGWSQGNCTGGENLKPAAEILDFKVHSILKATFAANGTAGSNGTLPSASKKRGHFLRRGTSQKRATCEYLRVELGDSCASLAAKCGIRGAEFVKFNPRPDLCMSVASGDYVCCSAGDPYTPSKPDSPQPGEDGTCAVHLIENGDTCASLAQKHGITVKDIESFNQNNTWAWTECKQMLLGYNMCLSKGRAPLPPPQEGAQCGPLVPGTKWSDQSIPMAELNPCPLKACCSNWGFCGPFAAHCDIHAPPDSGPGAKLPGFQNTCVSNCGNEIKQNSGPPAAFGRIGYYESWNRQRDCLWLDAGNANTDGSYTIIHWGFIEIDATTFKPVINDPDKQWQGFKNLKGVKRVVSFGGWAYSTEAATYNIIRSAIIANRETFAENIARFLDDEGLDGVDIDWEYPGAPDIEVGGVPIGQKGDGVAYLRFLTSLKNRLPAKSVSIAAPASYWYLKAFPIDRIAAVIDYIVYMTYDLHGQWDYGNPNAFDSCESGKCIRSHVTKAGVPNNKIYVGESSYGRSFHMATEGCWGPMCEFTGSRTESDAKPGRCTNTGGYIANAEINEIIKSGGGRQLHDGDSNTDVLLYQVTKNTRRSDWKGLNFAGSIDWAVDLQAFGREDMSAEPDRPETEEGACIVGEAVDLNAGELCDFSCALGFCPEPQCTCLGRGNLPELPVKVESGEFVAWDDLSVNLNRLCKFACTRGFCPEDTCGRPIVDEYEDVTENEGSEIGNGYNENKLSNKQNCFIYEDVKYRDATMDTCRRACNIKYGEVAKVNYGCVGNFPVDKELPWDNIPGGTARYVPGKCSCDNWLVSEIAELVVDAMPIIAQVGCYMVMSAFKLVLDVGLQFIPGVGKALDAGLDMVTVAAQVAEYAYAKEDSPEDAFSWWLSPCGGTDLVPDDIKKVFDTLSSVADGVSSFKQPKFKRGSGKKGDDANPTDRAKPKAGTGGGRNGKGKGSGNGVTKKRKCKIPVGKDQYVLGQVKNTVREQHCDANQKTQRTDYVIRSINYGQATYAVEKTCSQAWAQPCYHYSSVLDAHPQWRTLTCPPGAGTTAAKHKRPAVSTWYKEHNKDWRDRTNEIVKDASKGAPVDKAGCQADEYPPAALLDSSNPIYQNGGDNDQGQMIRFVPAKQNEGAGSMFRGVCMASVQSLTGSQMKRKVEGAPASKRSRGVTQRGDVQLTAEVDIDARPEFSISRFEHSPGQAPAPGYGISDNPCWPQALAAGDPGFALLNIDPWYGGNAPGYDYRKDYAKGSNGS